MPIHVHNNENLKNTSFLIEEHVFINCKLTNCHLFYGGGPFDFQNATFENCQWTFRGPARDTVQLLMTVGLMKPEQGPAIAGGTLH